ncbi:MAG: ribosomal L7Ae/L30e/S12e/Gadd45 family protein [Lachnospiraceae bacterium]|nr:ribosomal L7Ae/L30e/S12e/Gadd45 family protein [Lachnospiraceae bacterium]
MSRVKNKAYSMLGLAMRARKLVSGEFATEKAVKEGSAYVVIVAGDASGNTKKQFQNTCTFYQVPYFAYGTKEELGHAIGKEYRASLAVTDEGFAKSIIKILEEI